MTTKTAICTTTCKQEQHTQQTSKETTTHNTQDNHSNSQQQEKNRTLKHTTRTIKTQLHPTTTNNCDHFTCHDFL
jgi:hypothetical protein